MSFRSSGRRWRKKKAGTFRFRPLCCLELALQRVFADLDFNFLTLGTLSTFDVPHEVRAVVGPDCAVLPSCEPSRSCRAIDAGIQSTRVEAERIRNTQRRPLSCSLLGG